MEIINGSFLLNIGNKGIMTGGGGLTVDNSCLRERNDRSDAFFIKSLGDPVVVVTKRSERCPHVSRNQGVHDLSI